jgi:DNA-binding PucR family transcriptional regulator
MKTLAVLLLDCQGTIAKTAQMLNLHTNSVKYRVQKLNSLFGSEVTAFPLSSFLAFAVGVMRVLES